MCSSVSVIDELSLRVFWAERRDDSAWVYWFRRRWHSKDVKWRDISVKARLVVVDGRDWWSLRAESVSWMHLV